MTAKIEYTKEIGDEFCGFIASGSNIYKLAGEFGFPGKDTIYKWLDLHNDFADNYARARAKRADARSDRIDDIVDKMVKKQITPDVARVAIDAEKWQAGKEQPKKYGDRTILAGDKDNPIETKTTLDDHGKATLRHFYKHYADRVFTPKDLENGEDLA